MSRDKFKTKVDKRFKRMFTDAKFQAAGQSSFAFLTPTDCHLATHFITL